MVLLQLQQRQMLTLLQLQRLRVEQIAEMFQLLFQVQNYLFAKVGTKVFHITTGLQLALHLDKFLNHEYR